MPFRLRTSLGALFSALFLTVAPAPARAGGFPSISDPSPPLPSGPAACELGETRLPTLIAYGGYVTPGLEIFTRLDDAKCPACPGDARQLTQAIIRLRLILSCSIRVRVRIVAAESDAPCALPDTGLTLAGPVFATLDGIGGPPGRDYPIALPPGWCVSQPAFLVIQVAWTGCDYPDPFISSPAETMCVACRQYIRYGPDVRPPVLYDLCVGSGIERNLSIRVETECCSATPTRPRTWGGVKIRYR